MDPSGEIEEDLSNFSEPSTLESLNSYRIGIGTLEQIFENLSFADRISAVMLKFLLRPVSRSMFKQSLSVNSGNITFTENDDTGYKAIDKIKDSNEYKTELKRAVQNANLIGKRTFSVSQSIQFESDSDLANSIHSAEIKVSGNYIKNNYWLNKWNIISSLSDRYDFHWRKNMSSELNRLNNIIYRDQQNGRIHPYNFVFNFNHEIYNFMYN